MIGLLVDAAIAVVTVLDRVCSAAESARLRSASPATVADVPSPGVGASATSAGTGGHLNTYVTNGHAEPLAWGPDGAAASSLTDCIDIIAAVVTERDEARAERDGWRETAELRAGQVAIGRWLIAEARYQEGDWVIRA